MMARVRPPLSCRTSPPQGGRLAVSMSRLFYNAAGWRRRMRQPISPLEGEMPGKAEGGAVPPTIDDWRTL
ncbi:lytic murein transglycosylase [Mesorhizobium sp. B3-2-1]|nr:lytic murein transglycosylase [Mesorhizobium sp. B3-2-1]